MIPLNRLRCSDYCDDFEAGGYRVSLLHPTLGDPADLGSVPLATEFKGYSLADLLITDMFIVCERLGATDGAAAGLQRPR